MTDANYTHITLVSDRSGSMSGIKEDAQGGIRTLVVDQAAAPGKCTFTGVEFDQHIETWFEFGPIDQAPQYNLIPRGSTALLDAVGMAIVTTGEKLAAMPEDERPSKVVFVVSTDGQENASREWSRESLKEAIDRQTKDFGWEFIFLAADPTAFAESASYGFTNSVQNDPTKTAEVYAASSMNIRNYRASGQSADLAFTNEQKDEVK